MTPALAERWKRRGPSPPPPRPRQGVANEHGRRDTRPRWQRLGALAAGGLAAGVMMALSVPPAGWWVLAPAAFAILAGRLEGRSVAGRGLTGLFAGVGLFAPTLYWVTTFSIPGWVAIVVLESAMLACGCMAVPRGRGRALAFPGAVVLVVALRTHWPFGGLPLGGIWLGQVASPLRYSARLGGPLLLVGVTALAGVGILELLRALRAREPRARGQIARQIAAGATALAVTVAVGAAGANASDGGPATATLRTAAVQGGGQRGFRRSQVDPAIVYQAQLRPSRRLRPPLDLVLWPEDVVALDGPLSGSGDEADIGSLARALRSTVVAGVTEPVGTSRFRNRAVAWGPGGNIVASVEKVHRVPFGEYVPGRAFFSHLADLSAVPRDAIAGAGPGVMSTPAGPVAVLISYEVFFPGRGRSGIEAGGQLLLVPTNTSSYSSGQVPSQEIAAARLQAIEGGRDLLQAAPTGYSAVIDNSGRVRARTSLGPAQVITARVARRTGLTIYVRAGDGPVVATALILVLAAWGLHLARRRRPAPRDLSREPHTTK